MRGWVPGRGRSRGKVLGSSGESSKSDGLGGVGGEVSMVVAVAIEKRSRVARRWRGVAVEATESRSVTVERGRRRLGLDMSGIFILVISMLDCSGWETVGVLEV